MKTSKKLIDIIDEMSGLNQLIVVDSNCGSLATEIKKITPGTRVKTIEMLTGRSNSPDPEIHQALQDLNVQLIVFITKNCRHFERSRMRSVAKYYLICVIEEQTFDDILARHLVNALRYDPDLKPNRSPGSFPIIYLTYGYLDKLKQLAKTK